MEQTYKVIITGTADGVVKTTKEIIEEELPFWDETDEWKEDYIKRAKQFEDLVNNGAEIKTLEEFFAIMRIVNEWSEGMCGVDYDVENNEIWVGVTW